MKHSKSRHLSPIVLAILIAQIQGLNADNYFDSEDAETDLLRLNDLLGNDMEDNEDFIFGRQQRSLFHQPRVDRSNLQVPYPRMGKRNDGRSGRLSRQDANYVVPMARVGRGDPSSMIPMARIGRSDPSSMIPIARIGRALNEGYDETLLAARDTRSNTAMIPIARLGRRSDNTISMIPLARIGRSQNNNAMIPMARIGRSVRESNSIIPMARIGRSNIAADTKAAMIPMARIGRSSSGEEMMPVFLPSDDFHPGTVNFASGSNSGLQQQNGLQSGSA